MPSPNPLFAKQPTHFLVLFIILIIALLTPLIPTTMQGSLWRLSTLSWFWLCILSAVLHQFYVLIVWRLQLHHHLFTRIFKQSAYPIYVIIFYILGLLRFFTLICLSIANANTLYLPTSLNIILLIIITLPIIYTAYSVTRYFSFYRLPGIDHFDPSYSKVPFIKRGIFKYLSNPIYTFMSLTAFYPALIAYSSAALILALITYLYIWTHYLTTERPDFKYIYTS